MPLIGLGSMLLMHLLGGQLLMLLLGIELLRIQLLRALPLRIRVPLIGFRQFFLLLFCVRLVRLPLLLRRRHGKIYVFYGYGRKGPLRLYPYGRRLL